MPLVDEAMQKHKTFEEMKIDLMQSGLDEQSAGEKAYSNILPKLEKELEVSIRSLVDERTKEQSSA